MASQKARGNGQIALNAINGAKQQTCQIWKSADDSFRSMCAWLLDAFSPAPTKEGRADSLTATSTLPPPPTDNPPTSSLFYPTLLPDTHTLFPGDRKQTRIADSCISICSQQILDILEEVKPFISGLDVPPLVMSTTGTSPLDC